LTHVESLLWVKRNQGLIFPNGEVEPLHLLAYVMNDVLDLGGGECRIVRRDAWWFVSSDVDWLKHELSVQELFQRVVVAPQHGLHSMRAEILINAYAEDAFALSDGNETLLKGVGPSRPLLESILANGWSRALVAFRLAAVGSASP